jgi:hypothetical protein
VLFVDLNFLNSFPDGNLQLSGFYQRVVFGPKIFIGARKKAQERYTDGRQKEIPGE